MQPAAETGTECGLNKVIDQLDHAISPVARESELDQPKTPAKTPAWS
jgi:hypothetical protein